MTLSPGALASDSRTPLARFSRTGKPGKQLPMMTSPVALCAAELLEDLGAEDAAALDRPLADVGALTPLSSRLNWTTGMPAVDDLVERRSPCVAPGTDVAMPWTPASDERLDQGELLVGVAALGTRDLEVDAQVVGRQLRAVDDLLDERVAQHVGHETELDRSAPARAGARATGRSTAAPPTAPARSAPTAPATRRAAVAAARHAFLLAVRWHGGQSGRTARVALGRRCRSVGGSLLLVRHRVARWSPWVSRRRRRRAPDGCAGAGPAGRRRPRR